MRSEETVGQVGLVKNVVDGFHVDILEDEVLAFSESEIRRLLGTRSQASVPVEYHLVVKEPEVWAPVYAAYGASCVIFHAAGTTATRQACAAVRRQGAKVGLAIGPDTPVDSCLEVIDQFDRLLIMTAGIPGISGRPFMKELLQKVSRVRSLVDKRRLRLPVQVDGGISPGTIGLAAAAGAEMFVAGSAIFQQPDPVAAVQLLRSRRGVVAGSSAASS